jgi:hypothetical protein
VLWTYVLTGLPAFGLFAAELWQRNKLSGAGKTGTRVLAFLLFIPAIVAMLVSLILLIQPDLLEQRTQKYLVEAYRKNRQGPNSSLLYLFADRYSAQFYSSGKARRIDKIDDLRILMAGSSQYFIAIKKADLSQLPEYIKYRLYQVSTHGKFILFKTISGDHCDPEFTNENRL